MTWTDEYNELTGESKLRLVLKMFVKDIGYIPRLCTTCLVPKLSKVQGFIAGIYCPLLYNILLTSTLRDPLRMLDEHDQPNAQRRGGKRIIRYI